MLGGLGFCKLGKISQRSQDFYPWVFEGRQDKCPIGWGEPIWRLVRWLARIGAGVKALWFESGLAMQVQAVFQCIAEKAMQV